MTELFLLAWLAASPSPSPKTGWVVSGTGAEMTVAVSADKPIATSMSAKESRPQITLLCHDKKPWLALSIGALNTASTTLRFDRDAAIQAPVHHQTKFSWFSNDRKVVDPNIYYFDKPERLVTQLLGHQTLLLRVTPNDRPSQETTFPLAGLDAHITAFESGCGLEKPFERPSVVAASAAPTAKPSATAATTEKLGEWRVTKTTSTIDDRPIVLLRLSPTPPAPSRVSLLLRCREKTADAYLGFERPLIAPPHAPLTIQASVDGGTAKEWVLSPSTDGKSFFFGSGPPLLKRLLAAKQFKFAFGAAKRRPGDSWIPEGEAVFALAGLDQASKPFLEACALDLASVKVKDGLGPLP